MRTTKSVLSAVSGTRARKATLLGLAALGVSGAIALSPTAAYASDGEAPPSGMGVASFDGALQPNGYYCGPAATRIALSAHGSLPSFDELAGNLGTTTSGTNSIHDVTRVLNERLGADRYKSTEISGERATLVEAAQLRTDIVRTVNEGDVVVANIAGSWTDTHGDLHSYPGGHYIAITGYAKNGNEITIVDPADRILSNQYQLPVEVLAHWIATRGYTA